jgi:hypothetical protein
MKDGFRSISLAARRAPSVGFVRLVVGVIEKMLRLCDDECKGVGGRRRFGAAMRTKVGRRMAEEAPGHDSGEHNGYECGYYFAEHK